MEFILQNICINVSLNELERASGRERVRGKVKTESKNDKYIRKRFVCNEPEESSAILILFNCLLNGMN